MQEATAIYDVLWYRRCNKKPQAENSMGEYDDKSLKRLLNLDRPGIEMVFERIMDKAVRIHERFLVPCCANTMVKNARIHGG